MTGRERRAGPLVPGVMLALFGAGFWLSGCGLSLRDICRVDPTFPGCPVPAPAPCAIGEKWCSEHGGGCIPESQECGPFVPPAPTPTPPSPSPTPEPAPIPRCELPGPQEAYAPVAGGSPSLAPMVKAAIIRVMDRFPARFERNADGAFLLTEEGTRAKNEEPGVAEARAWFYGEVVAELQVGGYCVLAFGVDQVVVADPPFAGRVQAYHLLNHGGGNVIFEPPRYEGDLERQVPAPTVGTCPPEAPPVAKFRVHVSAPGTFPRGRRVDATPLGAGEAWCKSVGFTDPDGTGQGFCPYGTEGEGRLQREACEAREGPFKFSFKETTVWLDVPASENPLQVWLAAGAKGTVRVCARTGACTEQVVN